MDKKLSKTSRTKTPGSTKPTRTQTSVKQDTKMRTPASNKHGARPKQPSVAARRTIGDSSDDETDHAVVRPKTAPYSRTMTEVQPGRSKDIMSWGTNISEQMSPQSKINQNHKSSNSDQDKYTYNMNYKNRGEFVIINNYRFDDKALSERKGSEIDVINLNNLFTKLGFHVVTYQNLSYIQMRKVIKANADNDHSDNACFGCAVLSHGDNWGVQATDACISIDMLLKPLKECTSLYGKPKIVIIQACRGEKLDDGVKLESDFISSENPKQIHKIPSEADFLYAYSTTPGYRSFRNKTDGSYFIKALCLELEKYATKKDILWILTRVNYTLAYDFQSRSKDPDISEKKQMPSIVSQLTKHLQL